VLQEGNRSQRADGEQKKVTDGFVEHLKGNQLENNTQTGDPPRRLGPHLRQAGSSGFTSGQSWIFPSHRRAALVITASSGHIRGTMSCVSNPVHRRASRTAPPVSPPASSKGRERKEARAKQRKTRRKVRRTDVYMRWRCFAELCDHWHFWPLSDASRQWASVAVCFLRIFRALIDFSTLRKNRLCDVGGIVPSGV
jgi:hypothetical protein